MSILNQLQMTPFEWTMTGRLDASPMEFVVVLRCGGIIEQQKFTQAILDEVKHQPLFQANAEIGPTHTQSFWRPASNRTPAIHWIEEEYSPERAFPDDFQSIDLESEIGLRLYAWVYSVEGSPQAVLKFVFQHACCDGKGGLEFIENTLVRYKAILENGDLTNEPALDEQRLLNRSAPPAKRLNFLDRLRRSLIVRPKRVATLLLSGPRKLAGCATRQEGAYDFPPRQCTTTLDAESTKKLGLFAKSNGATTNLVLARELFHVMNDHLGASQHSKERLRILIPFSLRDDRHNKMPAANCVSMAYLEASDKLLQKDSGNDLVLLKSLAKQLSFIRRWQLEYSWIESIESYAKFWPIIKHFARPSNGNGNHSRKKPIATTVMTNLGRAINSSRFNLSDGKIKVGGLEVETVHIVVPCNAMMGINFSLNFYNNRLTLDVSYLPSVVSRETAQSLLDSWQQRVVNCAKTV